MENSNLSQCHLLTDEVKVNLNMLRALIVDGIGYHVDCGHVDSFDNRS
jgi:hypothetical protein